MLNFLLKLMKLKFEYLVYQLSSLKGFLGAVLFF